VRGIPSRKNRMRWSVILLSESKDSPDCRVGKHRACTGDGWDHNQDAPAPCSCACHKAPELTEAESIRVAAFGLDKPAGINEVAEIIAVRATDIADRSKRLLDSIPTDPSLATGCDGCQ